MSGLQTIEGGVSAPKGFLASGISAGIKSENLDMALLMSEQVAAVAGTFTTNKVQGAHVGLCRERLAGKKATAVVINSKIANACTGAQGLADAQEMADAVAAALHVDEKTVFVCSTGTIGVPLPMQKIRNGIAIAANELSEDGGDAAAKAIMTTDTVDKQVAVEFEIDGKPVRIGGMAKGAGMIEPNMATMLAFLTTDAAVDPDSLQECLSTAVEQSFNRISVDGDQSCNDTVLCMANAMAGNSVLGREDSGWPIFVSALDEVTRLLAHKLVKDGEGATKFVTVTVRGALSVADAQKATRAIANSLLVKTSWYGADPNWGRVIDAVGYSGAELRADLIDIAYDDVCAARKGQKAEGTALKDLEAVLAKPAFCVTVDLNIGEDTDTVYTCDCSEEYVRINSEYTT